MKIYFDSSALMKSLSNEEGADALRRNMDDWVDLGYSFVSSTIAETEVRRAVHKTDVPQSAVTELFESISAFDCDVSIARRAGLIGTPKGLEYVRSMDAIHVATAESIQPKFAVTFDKKQALVFQDFGITVWEVN